MGVSGKEKGMRELEASDEGIPAHRLRAAGYADTFPKASNRDANGRAIPENQAQNRRVVIKLEKIEKST